MSASPACRHRPSALNLQVVSTLLDCVCKGPGGKTLALHAAIALLCFLLAQCVWLEAAASSRLAGTGEGRESTPEAAASDRLIFSPSIMMPIITP